MTSQKSARPAKCGSTQLSCSTLFLKTSTGLRVHLCLVYITGSLNRELKVALQRCLLLILFK